MKKVFSLKSFWLVFVVAAAAIFVLLTNSARVYRSETDILIIPKSVVAIKNANQILENLRQIPTTLAFYSRMVQENADVTTETVAELPDYKQKAFWNAELRVTRVGTSGVLKIIVTDKDRYQAETISSQTAATLIGTVGLYYDIKTDLDVRIIEPVITDYTSGPFNYAVLVGSILGMLILEYILFSIGITLLEKEMTLSIPRPAFFFPYKKANESSSSEEVAMPAEAVAENILTSTPVETPWPVEEKPYTDFLNLNKTASAPANLPIAEDESFLADMEPSFASVDSRRTEPMASDEAMAGKEELVATVTETTPIIKEATAEEVKARLNKLLSGKM